jgi:hypothetical protein
MSKIIVLIVWAGYTISLAATIFFLLFSLLHCSDWTGKWLSDYSPRRVFPFVFGSCGVFFICFKVLELYYKYKSSDRILLYCTLAGILFGLFVFLVPSWRRKIDVFFGK